MVRSFAHSDFPLESLLAHKRESVTAVLPARRTAGTVGEIVRCLLELRSLVDQVVVVDAASDDGTAEVARRAGAEVHQEADLCPEFGPVLGKGDAMWRALSVTRGELVVYLDADTRNFGPQFVRGLLGPLICEESVRFVKANFQRPFTTGDGVEHALGGGRVTELCARPLLSAFYPELAEFGQPLAGEVAARREFFEQLPFATGYAVEASMLLHARDLLEGGDGLSQVDLGVRQQPHQPLTELTPMAYTVLRVVLARLQAEGRLVSDSLAPLRTADGRLVPLDLVERPPFASHSASV